MEYKWNKTFTLTDAKGVKSTVVLEGGKIRAQDGVKLGTYTNRYYAREDGHLLEFILNGSKYPEVVATLVEQEPEYNEQTSRDTMIREQERIASNHRRWVEMLGPAGKTR